MTGLVKVSDGADEVADADPGADVPEIEPGAEPDATGEGEGAELSLDVVVGGPDDALSVAGG